MYICIYIYKNDFGVYGTEVLEFKVQFCAVEKIGHSFRREKKKGNEENKKDKPSIVFIL